MINILFSLCVYVCIAWKNRHRMVPTVSGGALNPTHSLTQSTPNVVVGLQH